MRTPPTDDELTRFGIGFTDEGLHAVVPPERSLERRARVRGRRKDGPPLLGEVESNRFVGRS
ncbi:hypothetical protein KJ059_06320 [Myxococcota bacterium]|nr:hypothetical protein [Myxococcota bacterium]MCZ7618187.1 hypothetical protein [Myxococcota bacterium]